MDVVLFPAGTVAALQGRVSKTKKEAKKRITNSRAYLTAQQSKRITTTLRAVDYANLYGVRGKGLNANWTLSDTRCAPKGTWSGN